MVSYKPLMKTLIDKDIKKKMLIDNKILSRSTLFKIGKGEYVSLEIVDRLCDYLECEISNIVEHVKGDKD